MSVNIRATSFTKRKNSTKRPTSYGASFDVLIKDNCDWNNPTFILNAADFPYNYIRWGNQYYFVSSVAYVRNNLLEVTCETDVLATFKESILDSTQFVSYSNISGGTWLPDTRIPIQSSAEFYKVEAEPLYFSEGGHFMLSVLGKEGVQLFSVTESQLSRIVRDCTNQLDTLATNLIADHTDPTELLANSLIESDLLGNAFSNAPQCIRSCIWVPFNNRNVSNTPESIYLGRLDTNIDAFRQQITPTLGQLSLRIPWKYSDWRRKTCENISVYLPFVGIINIPSESIIYAEYLTVQYSFTLADGAITYLIYAGQNSEGEPISIHSSSCAINYPIGINQGASFGDMMNTVLEGASKTMASGIFGTIPNAATAVNAVQTVYNTLDTAFSTKPTCIGGSGGGAGANFSKKIIVMNTVHPSLYEPATLQSTMGVPTMMPVRLSQCSGFTQCVNAHVAINGHADEMNAVDALVNGGFYIE